jgi:hypothetical protein
MALGAAFVVLLTGAVIISLHAGASSSESGEIYVSPDGDDDGKGSSSDPLKTIQAAIDRAMPGATIHLAPGTYHGRVETVRPGTPSEPITVQGPETGFDPAGRHRATLYGSGRVFNIDHSWIRLRGFTIDGQEKLSSTPFPTDPAEARAFKDAVRDQVVDGRLVYVGASDSTHDITGVEVRDMFLTGAGGECVRLRNRAHGNTIVDSTIQWCGMYGKGDDKHQFRYHNGEGVYVGTSPGSTDQPMSGDDTSSENVVVHSVIRTYGAECFDVKENAHDNSLRDSDCRYNIEPLKWQGSNVELRGDHNTLFHDVVTGSESFNLKLSTDSGRYDRGGNSAAFVTFSAAAGDPIHSEQQHLGAFCSNSFEPSWEVRPLAGMKDAPTQPCGTSTAAPTTVLPGETAVPGATSPSGTTPEGTPDAPVASPVGVPPTAGATATSPGTIAPASTPVGATATSAGTAATSARATATRAPSAGPTATRAPSTRATATRTTRATSSGAGTGRALVIEAEGGQVITPMQVFADPTASGGHYVAQPTRSGKGAVRFRLSAPAIGTYRLSGRFIAATSSSDSVTVSLDGSGPASWLVHHRAAAWAWANGPVLKLTAGVHTLVIGYREPDTKLDQFSITPV